MENALIGNVHLFLAQLQGFAEVAAAEQVPLPPSRDVTSTPLAPRLLYRSEDASLASTQLNQGDPPPLFHEHYRHTPLDGIKWLDRLLKVEGYALKVDQAAPLEERVGQVLSACVDEAASLDDTLRTIDSVLHVLAPNTTNENGVDSDEPYNAVDVLLSAVSKLLLQTRDPSVSDPPLSVDSLTTHEVLCWTLDTCQKLKIQETSATPAQIQFVDAAAAYFSQRAFSLATCLFLYVARSMMICTPPIKALEPFCGNSFLRSLFKLFSRGSADSIPNSPTVVISDLDMTLEITLSNETDAKAAPNWRIPLFVPPGTTDLQFALQSGSDIAVTVTGKTLQTRPVTSGVSSWFAQDEVPSNVYVLEKAGATARPDLVAAGERCTVLMLSGRLGGTIRITSRTTSTIGSLATTVERSSAATIIAAANHRLGSGLAGLGEADIYPLLTTGLKGASPLSESDDAVQVLNNVGTGQGSNIIAKLNAQCRQASGGSWQSDITRHLVAALLPFCDADAAVKTVAQRWMHDWLELLQGAVNDEAKEVIRAICRFVVLNVRRPEKRTFSPTDLLKHLRRLLVARTSPDAMQQMLERQTRNAQHTLPVLKLLLLLQARQPVQVMEVVANWLRNGQTRHYMSPFDGSGSERTSEIRTTVQSLLEGMLKTSPCTTFETIAAHSLDLHDMQWILNGTFLTEALRIGDSDVPESTYGLLKQNNIFTSKSGVRITPTPSGTLNVERTGMDTLPLRGTNGWLARGCSHTYYFETYLESKGIKRALVGVCCAVDVIDSVTEVRREARPRISFVDTSATKRCSAGTADVVGCGFCPRSKLAFFTLNGILMHRQTLDLPADVDLVFPFVTYDTIDKSTIQVNFGQAPFVFDFRREDTKDESSAVVHAAREAISALCRRAAAVGDPSLIAQLQASSLAMTKVPSAVLRCFTGYPRLTKPDAELIATSLVDHLTRCDAQHQRSIVEALEAISIRSPKSFTTSFVQHVLETVEPIRKKLTAHREREAVPFVPQWTSSNDSTSFITSSVVQILPEKEYAHAIGTQLPTSGKVSFSVVVNSRSGEIRPLSTLGQFYVGVTTAKVATLGNISSWKATDEVPTVWALHSLTRSQLHHCDETGFGSDPYLFACGMPVTIEVDRDRGTLSFARTGRSFRDVFVGLPKGAALTPFVQIIGQKTAAAILPGKQQRCIDNEDLLQSQIVSLYRSLLTTSGGAAAIAHVVTQGLTLQSDDKQFVLGVLGSTSDCRFAEVRHAKSSATVIVQRIRSSGVAEVKTFDGAVHHVESSSLNALTAFAPYSPLRFSDADNPVELGDDDDEEDDFTPERTSAGAEACLTTAVEFMREWNHRVLATAALDQEEGAARDVVAQNELEAVAQLATVHRRLVVSNLQALNMGLMSNVLQPPSLPRTFTFSRRDSSEALQIPKHYSGKLVLTPSDENGINGTYVAIANESIPPSGVVNVRIRVEYDWLGLLPQLRPIPLTAGFYVGLCLESYRGRQRDHTLVSPPDMWAVPSHDSRLWHLPHAAHAPKNTVNFFSRDTIRLCIDRTAGTLEVFRCAGGATEKSLGIAFTNVPADVALFPFVQLHHGRGSAMFLPENAALPRFPDNKIQFASKLRSKNHMCDGCLNQLVDTPLSAPNWYCCNHCQGFDLCTSCFNNHFHCGHTFTHMRPTSFLPSPVVEFSPGRNSDCEVSGAPLCLVSTVNCTPDPSAFNLKARIVDDAKDATAVWGVLRRRGASVECNVKFETCGTANQTRRSAFVGLGPLDLVLDKTLQQVLDCISSSSSTKKTMIALMSTDETDLGFPGSTEITSRSATRGFDLDDQLTFTYSGENVEIQRRGSLCRRFSVKWSGDDKLCVFVFFSGSGMTCSVVSQSSPFVLGKVGEVSSAKRIRVTNGTSNRWIATDQARFPLSLVKQLNQIKLGMTVYLVCPREKSDFLQCTVTKIGMSDEPIEVHDGDNMRKATLDSLFIAAVEQTTTKDPDEFHMFPEVKRRLRSFYKAYAPTKTEDEMDNAIALYSKAPGGHESMWVALVKKYGPEPVPSIVLPRSRRGRTAAVLAQDIAGCTAILRYILTCLENSSTRAAALEASRDVADVVQLLASLDSYACPLDQLELGARDAEASNCLVPLVDVLRDTLPSVSLAENWWSTLAEKAHLWVPSTCALSGRMRCATGFVFDVTARLDARSALVTFSVGRETLSAAFTVTNVLSACEPMTFALSMELQSGEHNAEAFALLCRYSSGESQKSSYFARQLASASVAFEGHFSSQKRGLTGAWRLRNGNSGEGFFQLPSDCVSPSAPLPDIAPIPSEGSTAAPTPALLLRSLATEFARRIRLATAELTFTGGVPLLLFRELSFSSDKEQQRAVAQLRNNSSAALEGLVLHAVKVCLDNTSNFQICGNAARLLRSIFTVADDVLPDAAAWAAFHAVTYTASNHWNSRDILECFVHFVHKHTAHAATAVLVGPLFRHFAMLAGMGYNQPALLSAACDAFLPLAETAGYIHDDKILPLQCFAFLADVAYSVARGQPLPQCSMLPILENDAVTSSQWKSITTTTELKGDRLIIGRVASNSSLSPSEDVYCEVEQLEECRVVVGICNSSYLAEDAYMGYSANSFGFDGSSTMHKYRYARYGYVNVTAGDVIGCRVSIRSGTIAWSVNGELFTAVPIPQEILVDGSGVLLCIQAGRSTSGVKINSIKERMSHLPFDAKPLFPSVGDCSASFTATERVTTVPPQNMDFYAALAKYTSSKKATSAVQASLDNGTATMYLTQLENITRSFKSSVAFIDLDRDASALLSTFSTLKSVVSPAALESMIDIAPLKQVDRYSLCQVTVRWFDLFSPHERTPEESLQHTVLAQLYRQIGSDTELLSQNPVFTTALMMTDSGHTPIDAGGPYSQVWTLLGEELTSEETSTFHRNPLFRFASNKNGKCLFPDKARCNSLEIALFEFFGKIMGHMVRAKRCMAVELSQFVWKFMVEDNVTAIDYVNHVDGFLEGCLEDDDLLHSDDVEASFPRFGHFLAQLSPTHGRLGDAVLRRKVAELCIVESAMPQLIAMRRGLWATLGRSTTRLLTAAQLEAKVCGEPNPTFEQVQSSISCQLPEPFAYMFWEALRVLTPQDWTGFFYFASAQKRYPLAKKISVTPTKQSPDHLPQASTCFSHVSVPLYPTIEKWTEKLRQASRCTDMELA